MGIDFELYRTISFYCDNCDEGFDSDEGYEKLEKYIKRHNLPFSFDGEDVSYDGRRGMTTKDVVLALKKLCVRASKYEIYCNDCVPFMEMCGGWDCGSIRIVSSSNSGESFIKAVSMSSDNNGDVDIIEENW